MWAPAGAATPRVDRALRATALGCAALSGVASLAVLVGWWSDAPELTQGFVGGASLPANAAVAFVLVSASLAVTAVRRRTGAARVVAPALALLGAALALLALLEHATGSDLGIDELLADGGAGAGRMSLLQAWILLAAAAAAATAGLPRQSARARALEVVVPACATAIPLLAYLYGAEVVVEPGGRASMSFVGAVVALALGLGAAALATPPRVRRVVARRDPHGRRARGQAVAVPVAILALGLVMTQLATDGDTEAALAQAVMSVVLLTVAAIVAGGVAGRLESESAARLEAEEARDRAVRQLADILDGAPAMVYLRGGDGRFLLANRTFHELLGVEPGGLASVHDEDLFGVEGVRLRAADMAVIATGASEERRERLVLPHAGERWFHAVRFPVRVGGHDATCVVAMDVTEHAHLERRLSETERLEAIGDLAGGVAHDFNNLITVINGSAELGLMQTDDEHLRRELGAILDAGRRGAALARQLLAFSRRDPTEPQLLDVGRMVQELANLLRHTTDDDVELSVRVDDKLPRVLVDEAALEQALLHLVANARAAVGPGGKVRFEVTVVRVGDTSSAARSGTKPGSYVRVSVSDNGVGMTPEVQARAFEPFFTTRPGEHTGLGLSSVYGSVGQAGGHVELASELGLGTVVRLYLPADPLEVPESGRTGTPASALAAQARLLVVEDDPDVRSVTVRVLRSAGFDLVEADDADDALAALRGSDSRFDVLITDLVMPDMSGSRLARAARAVMPDLALVIMSGYTTALIEPELLAEFTRSVVPLEKPFTRQQLLAAVDQALAERGISTT